MPMDLNVTIKEQPMNPEGVVKFQVEQIFLPGCQERDIADLQAWRTELRRRGLLGQDPVRYDGLGFGNLSKRMEDGTVLVTASQTGCLETLEAGDYACIVGFEPDRNLVRARGLKKPSSETLSHLAAYQSRAEARYVFHVHSPEIWHARDRLGIRATDMNAECGTPEMFHAIRRALEEEDEPGRTILAMGGHVDGILVWGETAQQAGQVLILTLDAAAAA
jgi:ribulose-5-phosphate 4-epimerase/fuculose-1-phosphate aldolase